MVPVAKKITEKRLNEVLQTCEEEGRRARSKKNGSFRKRWRAIRKENQLERLGQ